MEFAHEPVLLDQCIRHLNVKENGIYVDGTLGGGGHAAGICEKLSESGTLIGIDQDMDALLASKKRLEKYPCKKVYARRNYAEIAEILAELGIERVDGAVLDLGVSSYQLDSPHRGFSYMGDAPLDMRMDAGSKFCAYDVVNTYTEKELASVVRRYGEERWAARIGLFIANARKEKPIENTQELVSIIKAAIPASARREGPHPAKRTFQAIRIEVNDELGKLEQALPAFCDALAGGGRLCVISFHSLEDRIVKDVFNTRADPCTCPKSLPACVCGKTADIKKITKKPIIPRDEELAQNPRARSAKLRVAEKRHVGK
ncbi:MAG: 16S rRNA (cytosine(1402)-N(4))-methyltransferase RsmH [Clostridiales bacterium]|nr:16S rRNA (cytosine(1402)-N(4))-methyltransferase RsmH [Clostridiales bacterium]